MKYVQLQLTFEGLPRFAAWVEDGYFKEGMKLRRLEITEAHELPNGELPWTCSFEKLPSKNE